ncbi:uncharacterized protein PAC_13643 [Phialocephala subalpina]|uniref:Uncharacterized protein n=1 Tax=Phialocephala subalpina TaxID=576137 RepID=A0A1L7XFJ8_9HELO|nr:uncharacterized protein PAC_13643 [Phialocephala subalpina]
MAVSGEQTPRCIWIALWKSSENKMRHYQLSVQCLKSFEVRCVRLSMLALDQALDHFTSWTYLTKIFRHVKRFSPSRWLFFDFFAHGHVKDIRLTCRRFRDASSHLLVHFLRVGMTRDSLAHFQEISRHPTIRKGVQAVRVYLNFFSPLMANNILKFAQYHIDKLRETTGHIDAGVTQGMYDKPEDEANAKEAVRKMSEILDSWEDFVWDRPDITTSGYAKLLQRAEEEESGHLKVLLKAHEGYRERFSYQQRSIKSGAFIASIGAAMARMPLATRLEIHDQEPLTQRFKPTFYQKVEDRECLITSMMRPAEWEEARLFNLGDPPAKVLLKLPGTIHKAGGIVISLAIKFSPPENYSCLALSKDGQRDLKEALRRLKDFDFHPEAVKGLRVGPIRDEAEIQHLSKFLNTIMDTDCLESIDLCFETLWERRTTPHFTLGPVIMLRPWPNLNHVSWYAPSLHLEDIKQFVSDLSKKPSYMSMWDCHLLSGTWAEALDILRGNTQYITFKDPFGAECDDMTDEQKKAIFEAEGKHHMDTSPAENYLRGYIPNNPLRNNAPEPAEAMEED